MWEAVNQFIEQKGGSVRIVMTIQFIEDGTGNILGQRTISGVTGENNPNLKNVILNQLLNEADKVKAEITKERDSKVVIADLTGDVTTHLNT
jgi:hypothetical protein